MDPRARRTDLTELLNQMFDWRQAHMWCALPCTVQGYNITGAATGSPEMSVTLQSTIQIQKISPQDGSVTWENMTQFIFCPVVFPGNGDFLMTFPLKIGDEGLCVFASRCIDGWWQSGDISPQPDIRMHDISDGFFIPGVWSRPRTPPNVSTTTAQFRQFDGMAYVELAGNQIINIVAPGGLNIDTTPGNLNIKSNTVAITAPTVTMSGNLNVAGDITWGSQDTSATTHQHTLVQTGEGESGPPQPGS